MLERRTNKTVPPPGGQQPNAAAAVPPTPPPVGTKVISGEGDALDARSRRTMQETFTVTLVGMLCALVIFVFVSIFSRADALEFNELKDLITVVLSPIVTLLSAVAGFYFGANSIKAPEAKK
jgi:uncharacterized integral membrane protein